MAIITIVETRHGYNVQVATDQYHVVGNCSDGILSIAERTAYKQAENNGVNIIGARKNFIKL